jgi:hypothetical protein
VSPATFHLISLPSGRDCCLTVEAGNRSTTRNEYLSLAVGLHDCTDPVVSAKSISVDLQGIADRACTASDLVMMYFPMADNGLSGATAAARTIFLCSGSNQLALGSCAHRAKSQIASGCTMIGSVNCDELSALRLHEVRPLVARPALWICIATTMSVSCAKQLP